ncbi:hypothetical protein HRH25_23085 [Flavisolibacter sp. BT320]|nr:hypothetical protein [Flavisolibacter longurius]
MSKILLLALVLLHFACKKEGQPSPPEYKNSFTAKVNGKVFEAVEIKSLILPLYILSGPPSYYVSGTDTSGLSISLTYYPYNNAPVSAPITYTSNANEAFGSVYLNGLLQVNFMAGQFTITTVDNTTYKYHSVISGVFECSNLQASPNYIITEGKFSVKN